MVTERDLELLDDYLAGRMDADNRAAFQETMKGNTELQKEHSIQSNLIEGIRQARINELKVLLNSTPIPATSLGSSLVKAGAWVVVAAATLTGAYFLFNNTETTTPVDVPVQSSQANDDTAVEDQATSAVPEASLSEQSTEQMTEEISEPNKKGSPATKKTKPVTKPDLTPYDPTLEQEANSIPDEVIPAIEETQDDAVVSSSMEVQIDNSNRKLNFHYQFKDNRLILFGSFEKDLYTILEFFHENKRTIFLNYNSSYYLLDETSKTPTSLTAVTDPALLQKLREFKGN